MKHALIDMGSNSIRLTVYEVNQTSFRVLFKDKIMAGLAGYVEHGRLTKDGIECACQSLQKFQNTLELLEIGNLAVFATASLRNVANTAQAVKQIHDATGLTVEVLSGEAEAEYGFLGATCDIQIPDGLFTDIGGASAELALFQDGRVRKAASVPVGSLKLYRDCVKKILPGKESRRRIETAVRTAFRDELFREIPKKEHMICVGGTARASLRLCRRLFGLPEGERSFTRAQLNSLAEQLCRTDKDTANLILRYEPDRIHTLIPGIMVLRYLADRYGVEDITVSHYGVREGYLLQNIQPSVERPF